MPDKEVQSASEEWDAKFVSQRVSLGSSIQEEMTAKNHDEVSMPTQMC